MRIPGVILEKSRARAIYRELTTQRIDPGLLQQGEEDEGGARPSGGAAFSAKALGLFYFVLNGILLWLAQFILPGYRVDGVLAGILGSLVLMIVNWLLSAIFKRES